MPPEGDNSSGPADPNDGHGDGRGAAQTKEQEDEVQQEDEPVTGTAENTTAETEGTDWFHIDMTLIYFCECYTLFDIFPMTTEARTDASDPEGPQEDVGPAADETDSEPIVVDVAVNRSGSLLLIG